MAATDESALRPDVPGETDTLAAPPPDLTPEEAAAVASAHFGISGSASPLGSERDQNFRIESSAGTFVLKVANAAEDPAVIDMEIQAMLHIAATDSELPIARPHRSTSGALSSVVERQGRRHAVRLVTFLEGSEVRPDELDAAGLHELGATVARVDRALRGFFHPAAARVLLWDVKHAPRLRPLLACVGDSERAKLVRAVLDRFEEQAFPLLPRLRAQILHGDLSLSNVVFDADLRPAGILDLGDMAHGPLVCDLAVTLAAVLRGGENTFETVESLVRGYGTVTPLEEDDVGVLADAVAARLAATVLISAWRLPRFADNADYIAAHDEGSWAMLELFAALGPDVVRDRFRSAAVPAVGGMRPQPAATAGSATPELLARRKRRFGPASYGLSYYRPIHVVRAEGVWMFDAEGRRYLDAYNNVPVVGHGHARIVEAVARQARLLNTNTRYLHESAIELAERLTATMPAELDTCIFVNSGSEANDLAWRMATAVTGRSGGIVAAHAYHGVTAALTDLSPSEWADRRPPHVETVPPPDGYRGPHRRTEPEWIGRYAGFVTDAAEALAERRHGVAAMFLDPAWTSAGIFADAAAYLPDAARRVREAGGLFLADEVQAGFGRLGSSMWSFAASGVVPDLVALGKPMGNGHPVAALITRAAVSDEFAKREAPFFSTFGGNPVSCAAALAVLDVLDEEELVQRAADVGGYLRAALSDVAASHVAIGDVRGEGLLVGVELMRDPEPKTPAPREARAVMNGMRDRGVLIGTTGVDGNVLKIRPPLPFGRDHADQLVATLDAVLAETAAATA